MPEKKKPQIRWGATIVAGTLAALVSLSYSVSYGALIFANPAMTPHLSAGLMSSLLSCGIVAIFVALTSAFSFAIAGPDSNATAILAVMVSTIAKHMAKYPGHGELLPTVMMALALSTALCGVILFLLGYSKRGRYVRFIPFPVIGGFLAGTGYLLVDGAAQTLTGVHVLDPRIISKFAEVPAIKWVPCVVVGVGLLLLRRKTQHYLAVPVVLLAATAGFFAWLFGSGHTLADAHNSGLLFKPVTLADFVVPWQIGPSQVDWSALAKQAAPLLALTVVVAITILLNATGLDLASREDADFDRELKAAGGANFLAGAVGGIVGYLSISRSLLNQKAGATTRAAGVVAGVLCMALTFFFPRALEFLPRPVLTGLVLFLGLELLVEWAAGAFKRMPRFEFVLVLMILVLIAHQGFLHGVVLGVIVASLLFVFNYSRLTPVKHTFTGAQKHSNVERSSAEASLLTHRGDQVYGLTLQGFIFFGTSNTVLDEVKALDKALRFLLVDFRLVQGLDASAVLSFQKLKQLCEERRARLVLTGLPDSIRDVFEKGNFVLEDAIVRAFPDLDRGMEWIENQMLMSTTAQVRRGLDSELSQHFSKEQIKQLLTYLEKLEVDADGVIAKQGGNSDTMFFVESGAVSIFIDFGGQAIRLRTYGPGTIVGEMGFYTNAKRSARVTADEPTKLLVLSQEGLERMEREEPALASLLHRYVITLLASRVSAANEEIRALL